MPSPTDLCNCVCHGPAASTGVPLLHPVEYAVACSQCLDVHRLAALENADYGPPEQWKPTTPTTDEGEE